MPLCKRIVTSRKIVYSTKKKFNAAKQYHKDIQKRSGHNFELYQRENQQAKPKTTNCNVSTNIGNNNTINLSRREQVCLSGLRFERYFSHHQGT